MYKIQTANPSDLPGIAEIHVSAWQHTYAPLVSANILNKVTLHTRLATWSDWFCNSRQTLYVLHDKTKIFGFVRLSSDSDRQSPPANYGELTHLYLDPSVIGMSLGHRLFDFAKNSIKDTGHAGLYLWTLEHNWPARRFYENHGMLSDDTRDDEPQWLGEGVYEVRYVQSFQ